MEELIVPLDNASFYRRLNSKDEKTRSVAIAEARVLPTETLLALAHYESEQYRAQMKQIGRAFIPMPAISFPMWAVGMAAHIPVITFLSFGLSAWCGYRIYKLNPSVGREAMAEVVSTSDEPRLLSVAFAMMTDNPNDSQVYRLVRVAVKKLLPHVPLDGSAEWNEEYSSVLLKQLDFYDIELAALIMKVLSVYGSARTIPALEGMANTEPGSNERTRKARDAARLALTAIEVRQKKQAEANVLLRPSEEAGASLLRPSQGTTDTNADELLREVSG
ncbi:MAG: hypothetical protein H7308_01300 [Chthonomonadaceae bacterium]|nr:hypothetical protein [Chthonomonadaceae bacterium]